MMAHHNRDVNAPQFASSPLIQRELSIFNQRCHCTSRIEQRRAALHASLARVLIFDIRFLWWGLGKSLGRWLNLLRIGLATGRATFLLMDADPVATSHNSRRGKQRTKSRPRQAPLLDLGKYYRAVGAEWRWDARAEARVRAAQGFNARAARVQYKGSSGPSGSFTVHNVSSDSSIADGSWSNPPAALLVGTRTQEKDGLLLSWLSARSEPWLVVDLRPRWMTAFENTRRL